MIGSFFPFVRKIPWDSLAYKETKKTVWFLYQTAFVSCCRMADKFQLKFTLINLGFQILPVFLSITIL